MKTLYKKCVEYVIAGVLVYSLTLTFLTPARPESIKEMDFSLFKSDFRPQFDLIQFIYASGDITPHTTESFIAFVEANKIEPGATVILDSPGGSLAEGIELGEKIRQFGFNTDIGKLGPRHEDIEISPEDKKLLNSFGIDTQPPQTLSGICLSACSLAYLGGIKRYLTERSVYGVHRFSSDLELKDPINNVQIVAGAMVDYIKRMGADPLLFSMMTTAGPSEIAILTKDELKSLRIAIGSDVKDDWTLKAIPEGIYLVGTHIDDRGVSKIVFQCNNSKLLNIVFIPALAAGDVERILEEMPEAGYFVDQDVTTLSPDRYSKIPLENEIQIFWEVLPQDLAAMLSAKKLFGFGMHNKNIPGMYSGVLMGFGENGRDVIKNYASNCWK